MITARSKKVKILLVDDDRELLDSLWIFLHDQGYDIALAPTGADALTRIRCGFIPNLIVSEIHLPKMDGFELCRSIRQDKVLSNIPILFWTAWVGDEDRMRIYQTGADDYMTKPIISNELTLKISILLDIYFRNGPQAVFCPIYQRVVTWMKTEDSRQSQCLNRDNCDRKNKIGFCIV